MHVPSPFVAVALFYVVCASIEGALFAEQTLTRRHERQPPQGQTLTVPTGDYQAYHLQLSAFPSAQLHRIRGVFRDGRSWVPGPASVRQQAGELQLNGNQIQGTLKWAKQAKGAAAIDLQAEIRAEVLADGRIQGTWSCEGVEEQRGQQDHFRKQGELKGWLRSLAELQQNNAVHEQASWTSYMGSQHNMQAFDSERELVDDLRQARLIWRSEDPIPTGQGNGVPFGRSSRVPRAVDHWSIGGGAGPVLLDGRIYVFYTQPVHAAPFRKPHIRLLADLYRQEFLKEEEKQQRKQAESPEDLLGGFGGLDLELEEDTPEKRKQDLEAVIDRIPWHAKEKYAIYADEVLVCIEASSGRTLWKATFPHAGVNWQDHKTGPVNLTPVVDEESVYFTGTTGRVYALDRKSGELRWTAIMPSAGDVATKTPYTGNYHAYDDNFCQSPLLLGNVLLVPDHQFTLYAFDTETGKELWRQEQGVGRVVTPLPYVEGDEAYVVTMLNLKDPKDPRETLGSRFQLLRVRDGKVMWTQEGTYSRAMMLQEDILVILGESVDAIRKIKVEYADLYGFRISAAGAKQLWNSTFREAPFLSMNSVPVIQGQRVFTTDRSGFRILDLESGETLQRVRPKGGSKMSVSVLANGKLMNRIDSAHGANAFLWINDTQGQATLAHGWSDKEGQPTHVWTPPHETTNSYSSKPMMYVIADGRLYLRGAVGLYCYDLRKEP